VRGKCDPLKSVVAIFRINTLTPTLTVGSDVNQVYGPSRRTGKEVNSLSVWRCRLCGASWRSPPALSRKISS